jgi:hypothetical protein
VGYSHGEYWFSPSVKWADIDLCDSSLVDKVVDRIDGFYLGPAEALAKQDHPFAAGLIVLCALDAIARLRTGLSGDKKGDVEKRFVAVAMELRSFKAEGNAKALYDRFRNGVVHEARVKQSAAFSCEESSTLRWSGKQAIVNPELLVGEVRLLMQTMKSEGNAKFLGTAKTLLVTDSSEQ